MEKIKEKPIEKSDLISEILRRNENLKESITKTNGKLNISEVLEKFPKAKELFESEEKVKYIVYKKKITFPILIVFLSLISIFLFPVFILDLLNFRMTETSYWFLFLVVITGMIINQTKEIIILTNKSIILGKKSSRSKKIKYSNIKGIEAKVMNSNTIYFITDILDKKNRINVNKSVYRGSIYTEILDEASKGLEVYLNPEEKKKKAKAKIWSILWVLLLDIILIVVINMDPRYKEVKLLGYSMSVIISMFIIIQTLFFLAVVSFKGRKQDK